MTFRSMNGYFIITDVIKKYNEVRKPDPLQTRFPHNQKEPAAELNWPGAPSLRSL